MNLLDMQLEKQTALEKVEKIFILGLGNRDRGDDAVGCLAAALLAHRLGHISSGVSPGANWSALEFLPAHGALFRRKRLSSGRDGSLGLHAPHEREIEIQTACADTAGLMESWRGKDRVVIFDAVCLENARPGELRTFCVHAEPLPALASFASSHILGLADAVELARVFGELPKDMRIIGIQAKSFAHFAPLSPEVKLGMEDAVEQVYQELL